LRNLGVEDYGLYNVYWWCRCDAFIYKWLCSRCYISLLTFSLGSKEEYNYQQIFSAAFYIHVIIALIIALLGETMDSGM
jgi:hypothetical protein